MEYNKGAFSAKSSQSLYLFPDSVALLPRGLVGFGQDLANPRYSGFLPRFSSVAPDVIPTLDLPKKRIRAKAAPGNDSLLMLAYAKKPKGEAGATPRIYFEHNGELKVVRFCQLDVSPLLASACVLIMYRLLLQIKYFREGTIVDIAATKGFGIVLYPEGKIGYSTDYGDDTGSGEWHSVDGVRADKIAAGGGYGMGCLVGETANACFFYDPQAKVAMKTRTVNLNLEIKGGPITEIYGMDGSDLFASFLVNGGDADDSFEKGDANAAADDDAEEDWEDAKMPAK